MIEIGTDGKVSNTQFGRIELPAPPLTAANTGYGGLNGYMLTTTLQSIVPSISIDGLLKLLTAAARDHAMLVTNNEEQGLRWQSIGVPGGMGGVSGLGQATIPNNPMYNYTAFLHHSFNLQVNYRREAGNKRKLEKIVLKSTPNGVPPTEFTLAGDRVSEIDAGKLYEFLAKYMVAKNAADAKIQQEKFDKFIADISVPSNGLTPAAP